MRPAPRGSSRPTSPPCWRVPSCSAAGTRSTSTPATRRHRAVMIPGTDLFWARACRRQTQKKLDTVRRTKYRPLGLFVHPSKMSGKCKEVRLEGGDLAPEAVLFAASLWCPPPVGLDRNARGLSGSSPRSVFSSKSSGAMQLSRGSTSVVMPLATSVPSYEAKFTNIGESEG